MTAPLGSPQISVIIPAYNAEGVLGLQLDALADQADAPSYEVLVVDNKSTDGTAALVRERARGFPVPLRLVQADLHQGPGYARNVGAREARADLLMFADADDVVSRWWVAHGARAFTATDFWSGGSQLMTDAQMAGSIADIRNAMGDTALWTDVVAGDLAQAFPVVMGGNFGASKEVYDRLGGFDLSLGGVYEDNDLGVRAHLAGVPVDSAPGVRIAFRGKWDLRFRARLARRSARSHAVVAARYGLGSRSHFPSPFVELPRATASAALMATGRKRADWPGVWLRLNTAVGYAGGRAEALWPFLDLRVPAMGVGLQRQGKGKSMEIPGAASMRRLLNEAAQSRLLPHQARMTLLGRLGLRGADRVRVVGGAHLVEPRDLVAGRGVFINDAAYIDRGPVTLGENVYIGPRAVIITARHSVGDERQRAGDGAPAPVVVGDGTWIGANATILPGVTVGRGCVIAAGAVVTADCAPNGLYAGVPARRVKDLSTGAAAALEASEGVA